MCFDSTVSTAEDPRLRIESFAIVNLHGVFHQAIN